MRFYIFTFFMQLFVCEFQIKKNQIILEDSNVLYQLRKVLRSKIGDGFFIQKNWYADCRYEINIHNRDEKGLIWDIVNIIYNQLWSNTYWMIVCMPNKWDKVEIIVQKLTEIGINHIVFRPSERSIIKESNQSKIERCEKISKEALEQSWGRCLPKIEFSNDFKTLLENSRLIVFDKHIDQDWSWLLKDDQNWSKIYWLVWPEWWLTDNDYKMFWNNFGIKSLWENILRTETAAIIGGREIKNLGL